jgi:hypothetical protein
VEIVIRGTHLPGRQCRHGASTCENLHVALQVGREPKGLVPGDAESAEWVTEAEVVDVDGSLDVRGPAVQGRHGERFLYLTWGDLDGESFSLFRRAKLMLSDVRLGGVRLSDLKLGEARTAVPPRRLTATVNLTDEQGLPRCARVRPPSIHWTVE